MAVRPTEKKLPPVDPIDPAKGDVKPKDLGYSKSDAAHNIHLISYLPLHVAKGYKNTYVVFATGADEPESYNWNVVKLDPTLKGGKQKPKTSKTKDGVFSFTFTEVGCFQVSMSPLDKKGKKILSSPLVLHHWVFDPSPRFVHSAPVAGLAGPEVSEELITHYQNWIYEAADKTDAATEIPPRALAALAYQAISQNAYAARIDRIEAIRKELNDNVALIEKNKQVKEPAKPAKVVWNEFFKPLGVCQLKPELLAMAIIQNPQGEKLFWGEFDSPDDKGNDNKRLDQEKDLQASILKLDDDCTVMRAVFNILRFPKSNLAASAKLFGMLKNRASRYPTLTREIPIGDKDKDKLKLLADANNDAIKVVASEFGEVPRKTDKDKYVPTAFGKGVAKLVGNPLLVDLFDNGRIYSGFRLRHGDHDQDAGKTVYGGLEISVDNGADLNAPDYHTSAGAGFVAALRKDLAELGFFPANGDDAGKFGDNTHWAVKEFQIYAGLNTIAVQEPDPAPGPPAPPAKPYIKKLNATPNPILYRGPISGVVNFETRALIQIWKNKRLRCPVVANAIEVDIHFQPKVGGNPVENIWDGESQPANKKLQVWVRDFSGYYAIPAGTKTTTTNLDQPIAAGFNVPDLEGFVVLGKQNDAGGGGIAEPQKGLCWSNTVYDSSQYNSPAGLDTPARISTFRVMRTIMKIEPGGYLDGYNAWDVVIFSMGFCHWNIRDELPAVLDYFQEKEPLEFQTLFGRFGLGIGSAAYISGKSILKAARDQTDSNGLFGSKPLPHGKRLLVGNATRVSNLNMQCDCDVSGQFSILVDKHTTIEWKNFHHWHWIYRFIMGLRTSTVFQKRMLEFLRVRIHDIREVKWPNYSPTAKGIKDAMQAWADLIKTKNDLPAEIATMKARQQVLNDKVAKNTATDPEKDELKKLNDDIPKKEAALEKAQKDEPAVSAAAIAALSKNQKDKKAKKEPITVKADDKKDALTEANLNTYLEMFSRLEHLSTNFPKLPATPIKNVFTSEKMMAMLLQWHVFSPNDFFIDGTVSDDFLKVFFSACDNAPNAPLNTSDTPDKWLDKDKKALPNEQYLFDAFTLEGNANADIVNRLPPIANWQLVPPVVFKDSKGVAQNNALSVDIGSFTLDEPPP